MWVCLVAKHDGSVANSEQGSTPRRPASSSPSALNMGLGLRAGPRLIAAGDGLVEDQGANELAGR